MTTDWTCQELPKQAQPKKEGCPMASLRSSDLPLAIVLMPSTAGGLGRPRQGRPPQGSDRGRLLLLRDAAQGEVDAAAVVDLAHPHGDLIADVDDILHLLNPRF